MSSDMAPGVGAQSAWRQLVDLAGRGRAPDGGAVLARLRMLRPAVPRAVRAASARALAFAAPDAGLVELFAEDDLAVAAPVLRTAALSGPDWLALLPRLTPASRAVLRHRRDLPADAVRGLESFGPIDFALPAPEAAAPEEPQAAPAAAPLPPAPAAPFGPSPFLALGEVARGLPVVAEALARAKAAAPAPAADFAIPELVARIEAFRRTREQAGEPEARPGAGPGAALDLEPAPDAPATAFRYRTDALGVVTAVDGVAPGALVGLSLAHPTPQGLAQVDGVAAGGFRRRSRFGDARLEVGGGSTAAGSWRLTGVPGFDPSTGRFTGFVGTGRRPRADESAGPLRAAPAADLLRQLVHELRTPTTAISGFAELIETELLGPVPGPCRDRAALIRTRAADLLAAIDDLDTAARIQGSALELRPAPVPLAPVLERAAADLGPLASLRGAAVAVDAPDLGLRVLADDRALERLVGRLLATLVAAAGRGERLRVEVLGEMPGGVVEVALDWPRALVGLDTDALMRLEDEGDAEDGDRDRGGAPLLGTGFALRLARNLAAQLGGALLFGPDRLTLRLPAAVGREMGRATTS